MQQLITDYCYHDHCDDYYQCVYSSAATIIEVSKLNLVVAILHAIERRFEALFLSLLYLLNLTSMGKRVRGS